MKIFKNFFQNKNLNFKFKKKLKLIFIKIIMN